jgi:hypothetical protein
MHACVARQAAVGRGQPAKISTEREGAHPPHRTAPVTGAGTSARTTSGASSLRRARHAVAYAPALVVVRAKIMVTANLQSRVGWDPNLISHRRPRPIVQLERAPSSERNLNGADAACVGVAAQRELLYSS